MPDHTRSTMLALLEGQSSILIGQSGMGKSSLINLIIPDAEIATREISAALDTGKHTTTFTRLFQIHSRASLEHLQDQTEGKESDNPGVSALNTQFDTAIIDSPGFQEFGLHHLSEGMLERAFPEFEAYLGKCKFYNCHHHSEPQCAVTGALQSGAISALRYDLFKQLVHEAAQTIGY